MPIKITPKMSFKEAFAKARKEQGAGGVFEYKGKKYTTNRADDKKNMAKTATPKDKLETYADDMSGGMPEKKAARNKMDMAERNATINTPDDLGDGYEFKRGGAVKKKMGGMMKYKEGGMPEAVEMMFKSKAKKAAKKKPVKKNMGGMMGYKKGGKVRGCGMAKQGVRAAKMVTMKGS